MNMSHPINLTFFLPEIFEHYWYATLSVFVLFIVFLIGFFGVSRMNALIPSRSQAAFEFLINGIYRQAQETLGHEGMKYLPICFGMGFYSVLNNVGGIIPFWLSSSATLNTTLPPALLIFVIYNYVGIRKMGLVPYFKQFMGPVVYMAPFMFVIEVISHITRPVTHSVRLYGNMMGGDLLIFILLALVPVAIPSAMMLFEGFEVVLQAYVYMLLSMIYIGGALEEHEH